MNAPRASWDPSRTWVFSVGIVTYPDGEHWPTEGRRDDVLVETFVRRGVPRGQVAVLRDADATLDAVRAGLEAIAARAREGDTLIVYYAGHGDRSEAGTGSFVLYDDVLPTPAVFAIVERRFRGSHAMLFADCCFSGQLALDAIHRAGRVAYGVLTSSSSSLTSTGAWTFTDCVIRAFDGALAVDGDGDGRVTFRELANYAERTMAYGEGQLSTFVATAGFDADLVLGAGTRRAHPLVGEYVRATASDGETYKALVTDARPGELRVHYVGWDDADDEWVAEGEVSPWEPVQWAPGTRVEAQDEDEAWWPAEVLASRAGVHLVHFDGWDDTWDEWIEPERLRAPSGGRTRSRPRRAR